VKLILASASPARAQLLHNAGLEFGVEATGVDEEALRVSLAGKEPAAIARALAEAKALAVSKNYPGVLVLGADQVAVLDGAIRSKSRNMEEARTSLKEFRGREHALISAICCAENNAIVFNHQATATLRMRTFGDAFLDEYLKRCGSDVLTSVGGYKIEGLGIQLFETVEGDHFTILGLPILPLLDFLRGRGIVSA
jgi:septum formation protein